MAGETDRGNDAERNTELSPREIVEGILRRGDPAKRGLRPVIEAMAYARWRGWSKLEVEQYVRLNELLKQETGELETDVAEQLSAEIRDTGVIEGIEPVLDVLLAACDRLSAGRAVVKDFVAVFESRMEDAATGHETRRRVGDFLERLGRLDADEAGEFRRRLTRRLTDWTLDYHLGGAAEDFEIRSRGIFTALVAADWSPESDENVLNGLDGALNCALDRLMTAGRSAWVQPVVDELAAQVRPMHMCHRLSGETLFRIGETLGAARRRIYHRNPAAALAITALEDTIHRPHRLQMERTPIKLELEIPGERGFGRGVRLQVFDISRDGCLAVLNGPASFEETTLGEEFRLDRGGDRAYPVRRLQGVVRQETSSFAIRPGMELILHETSHDDKDWAAIDGASVVRATPDQKNNCLWLGFHFDRVVPEVQQELEELIYSAA
jgi:hypothetical protein